ncbi:unnamed protein product, partial [Ixodes hexagonus]
MSVVQRPLLDNPFRPAPAEDPVYPSCYAAPVSLGVGYTTAPRSTTTNNNNHNNNTQPEQPADIAAEIAKKNQLYAAARASGSPQDWQAFKRQRCHIGKLLRESRKKGNNSGSNAKGGKRAAGFKTDFYCDACECGFADGVELSAHLSEHVVCDREGCAFQACPQLVSLHVKLQHDTELIRRCGSGALTEEDAAEWRRQRRLRYPTLRNIEAKKAVEAELQARREMLGHGPERRFPARRPPKRKRQPRKSQRQRAEARASNSSVVASAHITEAKTVVEPPPRALSPFRGVGTAETRAKTEALEEEDQQQLRITDSESETEVRPVEVAAPAVGGALGSLMACYGSDSDADDEPATKRPVVEAPVAAATPLPTSALCGPVADSSQATPVAAPGTTLGSVAVVASASLAVPSEIRTNVPARAASNPATTRQWRGKQTHPAPVPARRLTLLQKLLASEMRHERNVVLQCVHHVVQNNFFLGQVPAKPVLRSQELAQEPTEQAAAFSWEQSREEPISVCSEPASKQSTDMTTTMYPELTSECSDSASDLATEQPPRLAPEESADHIAGSAPEQSADQATGLARELMSECSSEQALDQVAKQPPDLPSEQYADHTIGLAAGFTSECSDPTA